MNKNNIGKCFNTKSKQYVKHALRLVNAFSRLTQTIIMYDEF